MHEIHTDRATYRRRRIALALGVVGLVVAGWLLITQLGGSSDETSIADETTPATTPPSRTEEATSPTSSNGTAIDDAATTLADAVTPVGSAPSTESTAPASAEASAATSDTAGAPSATEAADPSISAGIDGDRIGTFGAGEEGAVPSSSETSINRRIDYLLEGLTTD